MLPLDYFKAIHGAVGSDNEADAIIAEAKMALREELVTSVHYVRDAKRNGITQGLIITPSATRYKCEVEALPDEHIYPGDLVECYDEMWIVVETSLASPFQTLGVMWLCNFEFSWQNGTSQIIKRWGVLDSGVYSTTKDGNDTLMTPDKQYKIYLPYDQDTKKLYVDKRLATEILWDKNGEEILGVYEITGFDSVSRSYGKNAHLLVLNARSDDYVAGRDSITQMVCDYIAPNSDVATSVGVGTISGRTAVRLGVQRIYAANFEVVSWYTEPILSGVVIEERGNNAVLHIGIDDELVGETFTLIAKDVRGNTASLNVEVTT